MKNFFGLLAFILLSTIVVKAQKNLPPVYEIKTDTAAHQNIDDKYWQLLEDPSGKLIINQVSSPAFDSKFHGNTTLRKGYDYNVTSYWLRYKFVNKLTYPVKLTIPEHVAFAWLYVPAANGKWSIEKTGALVPWSERSGLKRIAQFVVSLQPGQEITIYEHDIFDFKIYKPESFHLTIGFANAVIKENYVNDDDYYYRNLLSALITGIMLLAALVNIFFYRVVREKLYLYFSFFLITTALYYVSISTDIELIRAYPYMDNILIDVFLVGEFFTLMHFIRHFLSTGQKTPNWDKFLTILSFLIIPVFFRQWYLPTAMPYHTFLLINFIFNVIEYGYMPVMLGTLIYNIYCSRGPVRAGIFALLPVFVWWSIAYTYVWINGELFVFFHVPYSGITQWVRSHRFTIELLCFFWLVMVFTWILIKRFQVLQQNVIQVSLDKERLEKEKEIERGQLIEKQNAELEQQVEARTAQLKKSIEELKTTQQQLIQSEKLASLGELTAGIAHEIQNPLNFVNNFSDVNTELIDEMQQEIEKGDLAEIKAISVNIKENQQKISHHGKRADAIVKGMLQHSRAGGSTKEPTDINKLADEYLRLAYHGLRAKDKSFNAEFVTNFDKKLPNVNIVPQDIGRVLVNLFTNAFYAVNQKVNTAGSSYKPKVSVSTAKEEDNIVIKVKDNGNGIPELIKDKIMQPFFTTKPTGEGTGLGLSLSYDIVVKGHGGDITVDTKEGEGSIFTIILPVN